MSRFGHLDDGRSGTHQRRHVGRRFARDERTLFTKDQRGATTHRLQILADGLAEATRAHGLAVEFPDPAVLDAPQRMATDVFDNERVLAKLFGHQAEARQGSIESLINAIVAHGGAGERVPRLFFRRADRRVDDHGTSQRVAILGRHFHCHKAAEAMADDERALAQLGSGNHGADFFGAKLRVVVRSPAAVAHAGQINRRDAKVAGEVRRNVAPPIAMCTAAVNEKKAAAARPRRLACPIQVVDPAARYHHELRLPGVGNGPPKPIWRRRADRKEIGWYGFAAQGGCTRITGWVLPLIGQHYIGRSDPADCVIPRQQRYLAVRGASTMLDHGAFLSWRGRTGCHMSVSPTGDRGFEYFSLRRRVRLSRISRGHRFFYSVRFIADNRPL